MQNFSDFCQKYTLGWGTRKKNIPLAMEFVPKIQNTPLAKESGPKKLPLGAAHPQEGPHNNWVINNFITWSATYIRGLTVYHQLQMESCDSFTQDMQDGFTGTGQSYDCPGASEATLKNIGKISQHLTTTKHNKMQGSNQHIPLPNRWQLWASEITSWTIGLEQSFLYFIYATLNNVLIRKSCN